MFLSSLPLEFKEVKSCIKWVYQRRIFKKEKKTKTANFIATFHENILLWLTRVYFKYLLHGLLAHGALLILFIYLFLVFSHSKKWDFIIKIATMFNKTSFKNLKLKELETTYWNRISVCISCYNKKWWWAVKKYWCKQKLWVVSRYL